MRQSPEQACKGKADGQGHHVAELLSGLVMMIAVDQEDKSFANLMREIEVEKETMTQVFKKRPEDEAHKEQGYKWSHRHRHTVQTDKGKYDDPDRDEN